MQRELELSDYILPVTRMTFPERSGMSLEVSKLLPLNMAKYEEKKCGIRVLSMRRSRIACGRIPSC